MAARPGAEPERHANGRAGVRPAVAAVLLLLLAGCTGDASASIRHDGDGGPTSQRGSASCPDTALLDIAVNVRAGDLRVRVLDGAGAVVFNETYEARDGGETSRGLFGAPGTWTLTADSGAFEGRLDATLSC